MPADASRERLSLGNQSPAAQRLVSSEAQQRRDAHDADELRGATREPPDYFRRRGHVDHPGWQHMPQQFEEYSEPNDQMNLDMRRDSHRGHGPQGYARSDERIKEDVSDELTEHDEVDARQIEVSVRAGEVMLSGSVESLFMKSLAGDVVQGVRGVRAVHNQIRVTRART
jgi:hypothetical protein